ncbi:MAG: serine/threonine protein kinase [Gammaproteobacteria bacterium]|nr:serine/threonine protein kinase [Gammaproteobacteria bacterium]
MAVQKRVLLITPGDERLAPLLSCLQATCAGARVQRHDPSRGMPGSRFPWSSYDLLVLEHERWPNRQSSLEWFTWAIKDLNLPPTIVLAERGSEELAVAYMKLGAVDYINRKVLTQKRFGRGVADAMVRRRAPEDGGATGDYFDAEDLSESPTVINAEALGQDIEQSMARSRFDIPGYRITRTLGAGGMASVMLGRRADDDLEVALKIIPLGDGEFQADILRAFMREYNALSRLVHPNVVHIHERAFSSDFAYIAMEYLSGGDLRQRVSGGIAPDRAKQYLVQILRGLGAAHGLSLVHGDLKPTNILFRADGTLALIDFGVAKQLGQGSAPRRPGTADKFLAGTPHYLSPEQILGERVDARSDLYSLGVVLYEMLAGRAPFSGREVQNVLRAHLMANSPRLDSDYANMQPLVDGLLAKDPDDRFQSAEEVLEALDWI